MEPNALRRSQGLFELALPLPSVRERQSLVYAPRGKRQRYAAEKGAPSLVKLVTFYVGVASGGRVGPSYN